MVLPIVLGGLALEELAAWGLAAAGATWVMARSQPQHPARGDGVIETLLQPIAATTVTLPVAEIARRPGLEFERVWRGRRPGPPSDGAVPPPNNSPVPPPSPWPFVMVPREGKTLTAEEAVEGWAEIDHARTRRAIAQTQERLGYSTGAGFVRGRGSPPPLLGGGETGVPGSGLARVGRALSRGGVWGAVIGGGLLLVNALRSSRNDVPLPVVIDEGKSPEKKRDHHGEPDRRRDHAVTVPELTGTSLRDRLPFTIRNSGGDGNASSIVSSATVDDGLPQPADRQLPVRVVTRLRPSNAVIVDQEHWVRHLDGIDGQSLARGLYRDDRSFTEANHHLDRTRFGSIAGGIRRHLNTK